MSLLLVSFHHVDKLLILHQTLVLKIYPIVPLKLCCSDTDTSTAMQPWMQSSLYAQGH